MSDQALKDTVTALTAQLQQLQQQVERLSAELAQARSRSDGSMRDRLRCPCCGYGEVVHAERIIDRGDSGRFMLAVAVEGFWAPKPRGRFQVYVCRHCGLTEWYVENPREIPEDDEHIRILRAPEPAQTYR